MRFFDSIYSTAQVTTGYADSNTSVSGYGGGVFCAKGSCVVSNCLIVRNKASRGGGVMNVKFIVNSLIANNSCGISGGGGFNKTTAANKAPVSCTIVSNYASGGVGGLLGYLTNCIAYFNQTGATISNISPNATSYYCCIFPAALYGEGNIANDPIVADLAGKDYHLSPISPCINRGINQGWMNTAMNLDGRRRIIEGTVDIGAYELLHRGTVFTGH
ncbi:MAG: choice-of-anchor Q domain-containing protein [Kiritimatiellae bacterium]|nr:choice-of-anchor Q domain-containing protein [Kiritimatiellia bacterium]